MHGTGVTAVVKVQVQMSAGCTLSVVQSVRAESDSNNSTVWHLVSSESIAAGICPQCKYVQFISVTL